jgi:hypothetical protein
MSAVGEKALKPLFRERDRVSPCDAGDIEAQFAGPRSERRFERRSV